MRASAAPELPTRLARTLRGHQGALQVARFSADGRYCITAGQDRTCCLWNPHRSAADELADDAGAGAGAGAGAAGARADNAVLLKQYRAHGQDVCDVAIAPDGARFASVGGDKCAVVWDIAAGKVVRKLFGHEQRISSCCFAGADAALLLTSSHDKTVRCWDLRAQPRGAGGAGAHADGAAVAGPAACVQTLGGDVFHDSVTRVLACGEHAVAACAMDGRVAEWDLRAGRRAVLELGAPIATMALSHDRNCLLLAAPAPEAAEAAPAPAARLVLAERASGAVLAHYGGHRNSAFRLQPAFAPGDAHVACGGEDGAVLFWDLVEAGLAARVPDAHARAVSCVDLARYTGPGGGAAMLTASFDSTAKLWLPPAPR
jgi:mitogen-activated protein kinase organizer 1